MSDYGQPARLRNLTLSSRAQRRAELEQLMSEIDNLNTAYKAARIYRAERGPICLDDADDLLF